MPSKEYQDLHQKFSSRPAVTNFSIEDMRIGFEKLLNNFPPKSDIQFEPCTIDSISACWVLAPGVDGKHAILYFHGGGFHAGSIHTHRDLLGRISRASNVPVLAINYRLAPEHPFPAALEDALTAYRWLLEQYLPSHLIFAGDSAGGGLVLSLCLKLKLENLPQPAAAICLCPQVDLTLSSPSIKTNEGKDWAKIELLKTVPRDYCRGMDPKNPLISPYFGDLHGLPPLLIQVGMLELLYDEAVAIAEKAKKSGVHVTLEKMAELGHCWQVFASKVPEGRESIEQIGKFVKKHF